MLCSQQCTGKATSVLLGGPSLTEGFPATNPTMRLLEFDPSTFERRDAHTYSTDLHDANSRPQQQPRWNLEYSFKEFFNMHDMSVASFEALATRLKAAKTETARIAWEVMRGQGNGAMFVGGYSSATAKFPPSKGPAPCSGTCRTSYIATLNGTNNRY